LQAAAIPRLRPTGNLSLVLARKTDGCSGLATK
jgi:hypothetical protein